MSLSLLREATKVTHQKVAAFQERTGAFRRCVASSVEGASSWTTEETAVAWGEPEAPAEVKPRPAHEMRSSEALWAAKGAAPWLLVSVAPRLRFIAIAGAQI